MSTSSNRFQSARDLGTLESGTPFEAKGLLDLDNRVDWFEFRVRHTPKRGSSPQLLSASRNSICPGCYYCSTMQAALLNASEADIKATIFRTIDRTRRGQRLGRLENQTVDAWEPELYRSKIELKPGVQQPVRYKFNHSATIVR